MKDSGTTICDKEKGNSSLRTVMSMRVTLSKMFKLDKLS